MKKIAFSLLIIGLALPMLSLAQTSVNIGQTDVQNLISPIKPIIAPVINDAIYPMQKGENKTCTACVGGEFTGKKDSSGCPIYSCPANPERNTCYIGDDLMNQYDKLISLLQDAQKRNNVEEVNTLTQKIIELKKQISSSKTNCGGGSVLPDSAVRPLQPTVVSGGKGEVMSLGIAQMSKCEEAMRWREKIAYYTKMADLSDVDLKNQTNLSRDDIKNILVKLAEGLKAIEIVCNSATVGGTATQQIINEPVRPIGVQSAQEIREYYKAGIENITGTENALNQVQKLKELKDSKDELVGEFIKNKKEIQASELNQVAKEVRIKKNEIIADGVSVRMSENRILMNIGSSSISVISAGNRVIIKDKNLEVSTDNISIEDNSLKIGGVEVGLAASDVAEKLNIAPSTVQLTTENSQPVYKMQVNEQRKLFGFIKINAQNMQTANANNGNLLNESKSWYYFLTTK